MPGIGGKFNTQIIVNHDDNTSIVIVWRMSGKLSVEMAIGVGETLIDAWDDLFHLLGTSRRL